MTQLLHTFHEKVIRFHLATRQLDKLVYSSFHLKKLMTGAKTKQKFFMSDSLFVNIHRFQRREFCFSVPHFACEGKIFKMISFFAFKLLSNLFLSYKNAIQIIWEKKSEYKFVITRPNCALERSTILCLYVSGFQRQVFKHVKILSER